MKNSSSYWWRNYQTHGCTTSSFVVPTVILTLFRNGSEGWKPCRVGARGHKVVRKEAQMEKKRKGTPVRLRTYEHITLRR